MRPEAPGDQEVIAGVHCAAFGHDAEAQLVDDLRDGGFATLSLVAAVEKRVARHILFSTLEIACGEKTVEALGLEPMAVHSDFQPRGVGSQLIRQGLEVRRVQGNQIVLVAGRPEYYRRFGFSSQLASRLDSPYTSEAFMALELAPGVLHGVTGRVQYPPPFAALT